MKGEYNMKFVCIILCLICLYLLVKIRSLDRRIEEAEEDLKVVRGVRILTEMISNATKEKGENDGKDNSGGL